MPKEESHMGSTTSRRQAITVATALLLAVAGGRLARAGQPDEFHAGGVTLRIGGPAHVAANDRVDVLVVVGGDARVEGTVVNALVVIGGQALVDGAVLGNVVSVGGPVTLGSSARVLGDISVIGGQLERRPGAVVEGMVKRRDGSWPVWRYRFGLWLALSLAMAVGALLFYTLGGRETLEESARTLIAEPGNCVLATLAVWVGAPVVSVLAMITVFGIPVALGVLFLLLPLLWFLGCLISGLATGAGLARAFARGAGDWSVATKLAVGLVALMLVGLLPFVGPPLAMIAGHLGGGALVYGVWRRRRGARPPTVAERSEAPIAGSAQAAGNMAR
jgi:hypothetical protein